jgi:hypothetical protein
LTASFAAVRISPTWACMAAAKPAMPASAVSPTTLELMTGRPWRAWLPVTRRLLQPPQDCHRQLGKIGSTAGVTGGKGREGGWNGIR